EIRRVLAHWRQPVRGGLRDHPARPLHYRRLIGHHRASLHHLPASWGRECSIRSWLSTSALSNVRRMLGRPDILVWPEPTGISAPPITTTGHSFRVDPSKKTHEAYRGSSFVLAIRASGLTPPAHERAPPAAWSNSAGSRRPPGRVDLRDGRPANRAYH